VKIFGHQFKHLDDETLAELMSLEREQAIYSDHWIDGLDDFRHVRIGLTHDEMEEYVRAMAAFDRFRGSSAKWARNVRGIPSDIAARADSYCIRTRDGQQLGPPWHCAAAFMGKHLESVMCFDRSRSQIIEEQGTAAFLSTVRRVMDALTPAIRCFGAREKRLTPWAVSREDDVRDLLYVMLRGSIFDIRREEPIPSRAGTSKVADLFSQIAKTIIEVKWIASKRQWKKIVDEIYVDIQTYGRHPDCLYLAFIVVDAARAVPDPLLIEQQISGDQLIDGKPIKVMAFIREP
jgi:hypothetical protein